MNTKTQVTLGFYSHFLNHNFAFVNHLKKLKTLVFITLGISELFAFDVHSNFICTDDDKPVITIDIGPCNPATKDSLDNICYGLLELSAEAIDDQTPKNDLVFTYKIDLNNDGIGSHSGFEFFVGPLSRKDFIQGAVPLFHDNPYAANDNNPFAATGTYPIGIHKICWYVTDSSGNQAAPCQLFEIKDCKAPTPYCLLDLISIPLPVSGCVTIWAKDLDRGSFDNCTQADKLKYYFNGDPTAASITICCDDFAGAGAGAQLVVEVQMWVEDEEGNTDYCRTAIIVTDFFGLCDARPDASLSGRIFSIRNRMDTIPIKNAKFNQYFVGTNYYFSLPRGSYYFSVEKDDEPFEYVSTYDMILNQKHILGISSFSNPYQIFAADVNKSNSITAGDRTEMRNLILRNIDNFKNSQEWYLYPLSNPPPMIPLVNWIRVELKANEHRIIDFRAIKIGDLNDLISSDTDRLLIPNPSDSLEFKITNQSIHMGDTVIVDFYSNNFKNILGYQYTIKFESQHLKFIDIFERNVSNSKGINFGVRYVDTGFITTSWFDPDLTYQSYKNDEVLFTLKFIATKDGTLCDLISITSDLTPAEAYRDSFILHNIKLGVCDVIIDTKSETEDLFSIYPNPFKKEINFHFSEAVHFPLQIEIYSLEGKKIAVKQIINAVEDWTWNANQLKAGVYLIRVNDGENIVFRKMIKE